MKIRILLLVLICWALVASAPQHAIAEDFGIGSKAPNLDIEHWMQDGNGFFKPVKEFAEGNVYVIEFWATWCGPCILSMPHLSELQNKYRGRGVQIVSISDETVDEVKQLLAQQNEQEGKSFADITSAYCLTTDPDRSVYIDYMDASKQQGIPTAFIVGKSGLVEWIGHPMEMDEPLEAVVTDAWDREAFKAELKEMEAFNEKMQEISQLAGQGNFKEAVQIADDQLALTKNEKLLEHWKSVRYGIKLAGGMIDDELIAFYNGQLDSMKGNPQEMTQFAYSLYGAAQQGSDISKLVDGVLAALQAEIPEAEAEVQPIMHHTAALLQSVTGKLEAAIQSQQAAVDGSTNERQKQRLVLFLEELKEQANPTEPAEKAEDADQADQAEEK
jgi:thiol-disulfide isomerase/thioredoxin